MFLCVVVESILKEIIVLICEALYVEVCLLPIHDHYCAEAAVAGVL